MKIALLHDTFWPVIGGVEQVMRDQANMLTRAGHEVRILAGEGSIPDDGYEVQILPELAPDFPLNAQVRGVLEHGQADQNFARYRTMLADLLRRALAGMELTLVHDFFTMHRNLALTRALHDIAADHRLIAWTHDIAAGNSDFTLPSPTQAPWNLMSTGVAQVHYVAVSDLRAAELRERLSPAPEPQVIPNPIDRARLFALAPEMSASAPALDLPSRDFVLLLPSPLIPRKNIDFAMEIMKKLVEMSHNPLLLITAPPDPGRPGADPYGDFLRQSLPEELRGHVVFVSDFFAVTDEILRDLYLLADCLLLPSRREGFGLPVMEAAAYRLPIWCQDIPAYEAVADEGAAYPLEDMERLPAAIEWLESLPTFRQQRRCRTIFDPAVIYQDHYEPLLSSILPPRPPPPRPKRKPA